MRRLSLALVLVLALPNAARAEEVPRTAVISAFAPEWVALRDDLEDTAETRINGNLFVTGRLAGKDVVLLLSGVSMVNAAMNTQLALDRFDVERIVVSGIAGGVDPALDIGDVVVADRWSEYLEAVFAREVDGAFEPRPWDEPDMPSYGMIFTAPVQVTDPVTGEVERKSWFPVDPEMLETARGIAGTVELGACTADGACLSDPPEIVVGGSGVSGTAFIDNAAFREHIFAAFEARVVDMESAAIAHVAYSNQVPFIAFRSLSDLAGGGEGVNEIDIFLDLAAANSAAAVKAFLAALP